MSRPYLQIVAFLFLLQCTACSSCTQSSASAESDLTADDSTEQVQSPEPDTLCIPDKMRELNWENEATTTSRNYIEFFGNDTRELQTFFCKLEKAEERNSTVRVFHFGDSQILRDRGSRTLRSLFRQHYSGQGPGLQTVGNYYGTLQHRTLTRRHSDNWVFYDAFLFPDKKVPHRKYGMMSIFSRYADVNDTIAADRKAWVEYESYKHARSADKSWTAMRLFYASPRGNALVRVYSDSVLLDSLFLDRCDSAQSVKLEFEKAIRYVRLEFESQYSPDFYGVSFENGPGLMLDNIGLCGSAGTFFSKVDHGAQQLMFNELDPALVLLQFGGNTVPPTKSQQAVDRYSRLMKAQIKRIQQIAPDVPILVIGPSDMLYEPDSNLWLTYSWLDDVIDGIKKACAETGVGYWDMYRVMGGKGSMNTWFQEGYVNRDRIHFNTKGIDRVMELFYEALMRYHAGDTLSENKS